jgi:DNA-binding Lrp family transcriptional regulator
MAQVEEFCDSSLIFLKDFNTNQALITMQMPTAYVLINCDLGSEEEIIKQVKKLPEVVEVSGVYGVYDIVLKVKGETMDKLRETITWHIRRIDKVRSTLTMIVIEGQGKKGKESES